MQAQITPNGGIILTGNTGNTVMIRPTNNGTTRIYTPHNGGWSYQQSLPHHQALRHIDYLLNPPTLEDPIETLRDDINNWDGSPNTIDKVDTANVLLLRALSIIDDQADTIADIRNENEQLWADQPPVMPPLDTDTDPDPAPQPADPIQEFLDRAVNYRYGRWVERNEETASELLDQAMILLQQTRIEVALRSWGL